MAVVAAAEGAELLEAEEAGESTSAFTEDSAKNAASQGVNLDDLGKIAGQLVSLAVAISDLVRSERRGKLEADDKRRDRYAAGIVFDGSDGGPVESRNELVRKGLIPAYYSRSNIKELLLSNKLPYGWSTQTAVKQGFGGEIRSGEFRHRNETDATRIINKLQLERRVKQQKEASNNLLRKLQTRHTIDKLMMKNVA